MFGDFHELELRETMKDLPAVRFQEQEVFGVKHVICSYMISDPEIWNRKNGLECRGITFDDFGFIVCRPFEKFFNLNERENTQEKLIKDLYENALPGTVRLQEKRDGSMLTPVLVNGKVKFKTKKSFYSDVAKYAQEFAESNLAFMQACETCLAWGFTPIFEFTSPDAQIVVDYGNTPTFTLLAIRNMFSGEYVYDNYYSTQDEGDPWALFDMLPWIQEYDLPIWDELMDWKHTKKGVEGWVIVLPNAQRVKLKTDWYMERHRLLDLRERDVAKMVVNETLDDLKSTAIERGLSLELLETIESKVISQLKHLVTEWDDMEAECYRLLREAGIENDGSRDWWSKVASVARELLPYSFGTLMNKMRGKETDYKGMWSDRFEKEYSLRSVYNTNFGEGNDD